MQSSAEILHNSIMLMPFHDSNFVLIVYYFNLNTNAIPTLSYTYKYMYTLCSATPLVFYYKLCEKWLIPSYKFKLMVGVKNIGYICFNNSLD